MRFTCDLMHPFVVTTYLCTKCFILVIVFCFVFLLFFLLIEYFHFPLVKLAASHAEIGRVGTLNAGRLSTNSIVQIFRQFHDIVMKHNN